MYNKIIGYTLYGVGFLMMVLFGTIIFSYISDAFRSLKDFGIFTLLVGPLFGFFYIGLRMLQKGNKSISYDKDIKENKPDFSTPNIFSIFFKIMALFLLVSTGGRLFNLLFYIGKNGAPKDINMTQVLIQITTHFIVIITLYLISIFIKKKYKNRELNQN